MVCFVLTPRCFAYWHAANTFLSAAEGFRGRRQHAWIQEFLSALFNPQLILQFTEGGPMVLLLRKIYSYFTKDPEAPHYFPGGVQLFQGAGVQMLISIETHIRTCYFQGGGVSGPPIPSGSAHGQCHHNGIIFITVPLLTMIVRHWFVRINDRWGFPNDALVLRTFDTFGNHSSWKW